MGDFGGEVGRRITSKGMDKQTTEFFGCGTPAKKMDLIPNLQAIWVVKKKACCPFLDFKLFCLKSNFGCATKDCGGLLSVRNLERLL